MQRSILPLQFLSIYWTPRDDDALAALSQLTQLTALRWVPGDSGTLTTVPALPRSLQFLKLHNCDPSAVMAIAHLTALTHLHVGTALSEAAVRHLSTLREMKQLTCEAMAFEAEPAAELGAAPLAAVTLLSVDESGEGVRGAPRCLRWFPSLLSLELLYTTDGDLVALATSARQLRCLYLRKAQFTAHGFARLAALIVLEDLHFIHPDELTDDAFVNLVVIHGGLRQLARLEFFDAAQLGNFGPALIGMQLTCLKEIFVCHCECVTAEGLSTFIAAEFAQLVVAKRSGSYSDAVIDLLLTRAGALGRDVDVLLSADDGFFTMDTDSETDNGITGDPFGYLVSSY